MALIDPTASTSWQEAAAIGGSNDNNLQAQISGAVSGAPLPAQTAASMTDHTRLYVYVGSESGYTAGHLYYWTGSIWTDSSIVYQATQLDAQSQAAIDDVAPLKSAVAIDIGTLIQGGYINPYGTVTPYDAFLYSDYIQIIPGKIYLYNISKQATDGRRLAFYDVNKTMINVVDYSTIANMMLTATAPSNAKYMRFTVDQGMDAENIIVCYDISDQIESIQSEVKADQNNYLMMFSKIGGIGDSLMSGEHVQVVNGTATYTDRYAYSWLTQLCKRAFSVPTHYSWGGLTAKTWWNSTAQAAVANESVKCKAYYIGLGTNDIGVNPYANGMGTANDTTDTDSFAGWYKKIIEYVHTEAPNAPIFLLSLYDNNAADITYSALIQSISELYSYTYYIDFINESDLLLSTDPTYVSGGHYNTLGYIRASKNIECITNNVIVDNIGNFAMFGLNND